LRVRTTALHFNFYLRSIRARILLDLDRGLAHGRDLDLDLHPPPRAEVEHRERYESFFGLARFSHS
jgi:hypothetical protein